MSRLAGKKILVVEDEFLISRMIVEILAGAQASIVGPADAPESGLRLAREAEIDAAVLDLNLHGASSDEIANELTRRSIPFIVATGYGEERSTPRAPVLGKPFTTETLLQGVESLLTATHSRC